MSFYYDGDQLCYRKQSVQDSNSWTVIDLPYRTSQTLPSLSSFTAFLTLSFILLPIESITLQVDNITLLSLKKTISPQISLDLPRGLSYISPDRTLTLKSWSSESFSIEITYMNVTQLNEKITSNSLLSFGYKAFSSFMPGSKDPSETTTVSAHLRKVTGKLAVNVSSHFSRKMKETVLKAPPKEAVISMLTDNRDEKQLSKLTSPLSDYVFPKSFNDAKIFIGFPTKQSTSFKSHIAINQLIPTMERTAVDMANAYVRDWNKQILVMAGILSRAVYEYEFSQLSKKYNTPLATPEVQQPFLDDASYIMNRFEFDSSAPDVSVGNYIAHGFWRSSDKLSLPTQTGKVMTSDQVRLADDDDAAALVENIAIVPTSVAKSSARFLAKAVEIGLLKHTSVNDIVQELRAQTLSPARFQRLCWWCISHALNSEIGPHDIQLILSAAIVADEESGEIYPLKAIQMFQDVLQIPLGFPLPPSCLPAKLLESINTKELQRIFGWQALSLLGWLQFATSSRDSIDLEKNMYLSPEFSQKVLMRLSSNFEYFSTLEKTKVVELLSSTESIPTNLGMKKPSESYMHAIDLFPDLPIKSPTLLASRDFLLAVGVRESVDVAFVLKLLTDPDPQLKWSTFDVIKYLTANQAKFKASDWATLRASSFFEATDGKLYAASTLYPPNSELEKLGMRCLKWQYWNESTPEAKLIFKLGLKHHPPLSEVLALANTSPHTTKEQSERAELAFAYFLKNFEANAYSSKEVYKTQSACVKSVLPDGTLTRQPPSRCFTDKTVALFGFPVVDSALENHVWKLGIVKHPDASELVNVLVSRPPQDIATANKMFSFMSGILPKISGADRKRLRETKFVPVEVPRKRFDEKGSVVEFKAIVHEFPNMVYFSAALPVSSSVNGRGDLSHEIYSQFFHYVDFAAGARPFLDFVGVRDEPTITEIARMLVADPNRMYVLAKSSQRYMELLLRIASRWNDAISKDYALVSRMRKAKFLLGAIYERGEESGSVNNLSTAASALKSSAASLLGNTSSFDDTDSDRDILRYKLASVDEIVIADNVVFSNLFRNDLLMAPQIRELERLYHELGCRYLSQVVEVKRSLGRAVPDYDVEPLRRHIVERSSLFLDSNRETFQRRSRGVKAARQFLATLEIAPLTQITTEHRIKFSGLSVRGAMPIRQHVTACIGSTTNGSGRPVLCIVPPEPDWFDVSQSLVGALLEQGASPDSAIVLESLLVSDLRSLQRKGYNVNAIIKRREEEVAAEREAAEALRREIEETSRAEEERRKKSMLLDQEEKEKRVAQRSKAVEAGAASPQGGAGTPPPPYPTDAIGGGQGWERVKEALEGTNKLDKRAPTPPAASQPKEKGLFNKMWKSLSTNSNSAAAAAGAVAGQAGQAAAGALKNLPAPGVPGSAGASGGSSGRLSPGPVHKPASKSTFSVPENPHATTPASTFAILEQGIAQSRAFEPAALRGAVHTGDQRDPREYGEAQAARGCDTAIATSLRHVATVATRMGAGIRLYVSDGGDGGAAGAARAARAREELATPGWAREIDRFAYILRQLAYVFGSRDGAEAARAVPWEVFHMFWDAGSAAIAFNSGASLFFNLAYFVQGSALVGAREPGAAGWQAAGQLDFWFTVAAHELAHNLVAEHGAAHSHYMESYVQAYLPRYKIASARVQRLEGFQED